MIPVNMIDARYASLQERASAVRRSAGSPAPEESSASDAPSSLRIVRSPEQAARLYEQASTPEQRKIRETADDFVSILFGMLFKEMDKTVERTGFLDGGETEEMFRSFVYDEYAKKASTQGGNVLTHRVYEMLYEANASRRGASAAAPAATAPAPSATPEP